VAVRAYIRLAEPAPHLFLNDTPPPDIYPLSLHDALPISRTRKVLGRSLLIGLAAGGRSSLGLFAAARLAQKPKVTAGAAVAVARSEEHTSELQSRRDLVCRLLLEKKNHHSRGIELASLRE